MALFTSHPFLSAEHTDRALPSRLDFAHPWEDGSIPGGEERGSGGSEEETPGEMEGACSEESGSGDNGMAQFGEGWKSAGNFLRGES